MKRLIPRNQRVQLLNANDVGLNKEDFLLPECVVQLGYPPNRIDLVTSADGIDFGSSYETRATWEIDGVKVNFIDLHHLRENKLATGRHQDLSDLENLE